MTGAGPLSESVSGLPYYEFFWIRHLTYNANCEILFHCRLHNTNESKISFIIHSIFLLIIRAPIPPPHHSVFPLIDIIRSALNILF